MTAIADAWPLTEVRLDHRQIIESAGWEIEHAVLRFGKPFLSIKRKNGDGTYTCRYGYARSLCKSIEHDNKQRQQKETTK